MSQSLEDQSTSALAANEFRVVVLYDTAAKNSRAIGQIVTDLCRLAQQNQNEHITESGPLRFPDIGESTIYGFKTNFPDRGTATVFSQEALSMLGRAEIQATAVTLEPEREFLGPIMEEAFYHLVRSQIDSGGSFDGPR